MQLETHTEKSRYADGGYDTKKVRCAIVDRGARPFIPPRRNAKKCGLEDRDKAMAQLKGLGNDNLGKEIWGKLTGYSRSRGVSKSDDDESNDPRKKSLIKVS